MRRLNGGKWAFAVNTSQLQARVNSAMLPIWRLGEISSMTRRPAKGCKRMLRTVLLGGLLAFASTSASAQLLSVQLDYPPASLRAGNEGVVGFEVKLAKDGRVVGCRITQTSGHAELDLQTCRQMRTTARFKVATDATGKPTASTYASRLRWSIPRPKAEPIPTPLPGSAG